MNTPIKNDNKVLVVDDEHDICTLLSMSLNRLGLSVDTVSTVAEALELLKTHDYNLCLTDMRLPDGEGLSVIRWINQHSPEMPVVVMTAHGNMDNAIEAMKQGAFDYLSKPIGIQALKNVVQETLKSAASSTLINANESALNAILGQSPDIVAMKEKIKKMARTLAPVFIQGESGSGKELVARSIHELSSRAQGPFIAVNCGAIPEALTESEFFGYRKGSFTGATTDREGLFQAAHGGSLFLDEVADLPLSMQVKLLRAIQQKKIRRVGDTDETEVDVRIISATHRPLSEWVNAQKFRQDLFYRINVLSLFLPPLRERGEDIPLLAQKILEKIIARSHNKSITPPRLSDKAIDFLRRYPFHGNVRELENMLERALALCEHNTINAHDLGDIQVIGINDNGTLAEPCLTLQPEGASINASINTSINATLYQHIHQKMLDNIHNEAQSNLPAPSLEALLDKWECLVIETTKNNYGDDHQCAQALGLSINAWRYRLEKMAKKG